MVLTTAFVFVDKESPTIKCAEYRTIPTDKGKPTAMVKLKGASASDNSGDVSHVSCNPQLGTHFNMGYTAVTCEAVDASANRAECTFQIHVIGIYKCDLSQQNRALVVFKKKIF